MGPRTQGGGQEPSTSGREAASHPNRPRWHHQAPPRPLRPRLHHVESCSIALGLPPFVPMHRGSLRAAFEQLESPMQARQRLEHLSSLLSLPRWQTRELMLSSPKILTLSPRTITMRVQKLAAFVAACPPPLKSNKRPNEEGDDDLLDTPTLSREESSPSGEFRPSLLHGWDLQGMGDEEVEKPQSSSLVSTTLPSSMLFGFMPQELDTFVPPSSSPPSSPPSSNHPIQKFKSEVEVLSEVCRLVHREPRLLISPADPSSIVLALMQVLGLDLTSASGLIYRRPLLICRAQGQRVTRGRGGERGEAKGEEVAIQGDGIEGVIDHVESFAATMDILQKIAPPANIHPSRRRQEQPRRSSSRNTTLNHSASPDPPPSPPTSRSPSPLVKELILKEPLILTVPPGALLASASAILDSFPTLLQQSMDPHDRTNASLESREDDSQAIARRSRDAKSRPQGSLAMENNQALWSMVERCPELLCSSPSAVEGSCSRLSSILSRSKPWSKMLPKLVSKPRNLAVAISLGFNTTLLDRLQYLSSTNRDRSMDFKEVMVTSIEDFDEMWPGFRSWVKNLNNN